MSVNREDVRRIAALAAMDVDDAAMDEVTAQMSRILDYVSQIAAVEADPIVAFRPQSHAEPQPLREDAVRPSAPPLDLRAFVPAVQDGLVIVPQIGTLAGDEE